MAEAQAPAAPGSTPAAPEAESRNLQRPIRENLNKLMIETITKSGKKLDADYQTVGEMLLRDAMRERASDIHIEPESNGARVRLRVDGALHDSALLTSQQAQRLIRHFRSVADLDPVAIFKPVEARRNLELDGKRLDMRLTFAP